jgi:hypothetical protein
MCKKVLSTGRRAVPTVEKPQILSEFEEGWDKLLQSQPREIINKAPPTQL